MVKPQPKITQKKKRITKKEKQIKADQADLDVGQDFDVEQELEQPSAHQAEPQKFQSVQEAKKRISTQTLGLLKKKQKIKDDFFMVQEEQGKRLESQEDAVAEQLKKQYLKKQNRWYEELSSVIQYGQPEQYKGHTLCITGLEVTSTHIYSTSKDRSIIKWDRQTKKKSFISLGKDQYSHRSDIYAVALHSNHNVLATAADDTMVKLWDTRSLQLIDTLYGHKNSVNGVKFGVNSNNLCSISSDLTMKLWDISQRGLIQTFFQHTGQVLDIDSFNADDFITSGYDKQVITWKTQKETKIAYKGHEYAIDRVRAINFQKFITGCQDGSINLWHAKKTKPVFKLPSAHKGGWISGLDIIKQTNTFASAGIDKLVKIWKIQGDNKGINLIQQIPVDGIVTDLKLTEQWLGVTECDELRLGRWITTKCRNKIKMFRRVK